MSENLEEPDIQSKEEAHAALVKEDLDSFQQKTKNLLQLCHSIKHQNITDKIKSLMKLQNKLNELKLLKKTLTGDLQIQVAVKEASKKELWDVQKARAKCRSLNCQYQTIFDKYISTFKLKIKIQKAEEDIQVIEILNEGWPIVLVIDASNKVIVSVDPAALKEDAQKEELLKYHDSYEKCVPFFIKLYNYIMKHIV